MSIVSACEFQEHFRTSRGDTIVLYVLSTLRKTFYRNNKEDYTQRLYHAQSKIFFGSARGRYLGTSGVQFDNSAHQRTRRTDGPLAQNSPCSSIDSLPNPIQSLRAHPGFQNLKSESRAQVGKSPPT